MKRIKKLTNESVFLDSKVCKYFVIFIIYYASYKTTMGKLRVFEEDKGLNMQQEKLKSDMT